MSADAIRDRGDRLQRRSSLLDPNHPDGPALVMLDGGSKPNRMAMPQSSYRSETPTRRPAGWTSASSEHPLDTTFAGFRLTG